MGTPCIGNLQREVQAGLNIGSIGADNYTERV